MLLTKSRVPTQNTMPKMWKTNTQFSVTISPSMETHDSRFRRFANFSTLLYFETEPGAPETQRGRELISQQVRSQAATAVTGISILRASASVTNAVAAPATYTASGPSLW